MNPCHLRQRMRDVLRAALLACAGIAFATGAAAAADRSSHVARLADATREPLVYVTLPDCSCVRVFDAKTFRLRNTLSGFKVPYDVATDAAGGPWVADYSLGTVFGFAPGASSPNVKLNVPNATGVVVADDGTVYATAYYPATLYVFGPGHTQPDKKIALDLFGRTSSNAEGVTLDAAGNVYVAMQEDIAGGRVIELHAGTFAQRNLGMYLGYPAGLAVDGAGNLIVADSGNGSNYVFAPGATQPARAFGAPQATTPSFLALDRAETTLYVGDLQHSELDVYDYRSGNIRSKIPIFGAYGAGFMGVATAPRAPFGAPAFSAPNRLATPTIADGTPILYASTNAAVNAYAQVGNELLPIGQLLSNSGVNTPYGVTTDRDANLWVANGGAENGATNTVLKFAPGKKRPSFTIHQPSGLISSGVTIGVDGTVYVSDFIYSGNYVISEFAPGKTKPFFTVGPIFEVNGVAVDPKGNLYVAYDASDGTGRVERFAPHSSTGVDLGITLPSPSIGNIALAKNGDLIVVDTERRFVEFFHPGAKVPTRKISVPALRPQNLAVSADEKRVYVSAGGGFCCGAGVLLEFDYQSGKLIKTITAGFAQSYGVSGLGTTPAMR